MIFFCKIKKVFRTCKCIQEHLFLLQPFFDKKLKLALRYIIFFFFFNIINMNYCKGEWIKIIAGSLYWPTFMFIHKIINIS